MLRRGSTSLAVLFAAVSPTWAQWESGSDGTDGAFSPAVSTVVDLSLAASLCDCDADTQVDDPCRWDCPSPVAGRGVYDAEQWAVVYKYSTVDVPSGVTITFGQHPSGAPVVWLATGNITINGRVSVDGDDSVGPNPPIIPNYSRPGPGGFQGAQSGHTGASSAVSNGLGPGSGVTGGATDGGADGTYAAQPSCAAGNSTNGATYGNAGVMPLIGGSGAGSGSQFTCGGGGGAGGGAILIGSTNTVSLGTTGSITAEGGDRGPGGCGGGNGGGGSGGAIRLRAESISLASGSQLVGKGGLSGGGCGAPAGSGRVRIEASTIANGATITGVISIVNVASVVFPTTPPQLYVTSVCGQSAPANPTWGITSADVELNSASACTVNIEATGVPVGTIVVVRAIPARGSVISVNSTPLADAGGGLRTGTASVTFAGGRTELQLRANW